jgi:hypothetical protein
METIMQNIYLNIPKTDILFFLGIGKENELGNRNQRKCIAKIYDFPP